MRFIMSKIGELTMSEAGWRQQQLPSVIQRPSGNIHARSEGPGNPHNNSGAGLRAAALVAHLNKGLKPLGWAKVETLVRGCGWGPRWGWSGQSKLVSALIPTAMCIFSPRMQKWSMQYKMHGWVIEIEVELLSPLHELCSPLKEQSQ